MIRIAKEGYIQKELAISQEKLLELNLNDTLKVVLDEAKKDKLIFIDLVANTGEKLFGGILEIQNLASGEVKRIIVMRNTELSYTFLKNTNYLIKGSHKNFKWKTLTLVAQSVDSLNNEQSIQLLLWPANVLFENNAVGQIIEMDIKYDLGKHNIRPDAARELDRLVKHLQKYPELKVELGSHTDSRGSADSNFRLSQKRAEAAVNYVVSKGIKSYRLIPLGYGKNDLKFENAQTEVEHQQNRRTTVKIVGH